MPDADGGLFVATCRVGSGIFVASSGMLDVSSGRSVAGSGMFDADGGLFVATCLWKTFKTCHFSFA